MEYLVNEKRIRLNPYNMKYSEKIGAGTAAKVYLINGDAYKLYEPYRGKEKMTKEKINYLKNIPTNRIVLPKKVILDKKRNLCGYISKYIEDLAVDDFFGLEKEKVLDELKILREDFITLGDYKVLVNDASYDNTVFNKGIYLIDCGRFQTEDETSYDENVTISYNLDTFNEYFIDQIIGKSCLIYAGRNFNIRNEYFQKIREGIDIIDYLAFDMPEGNFSQYIKKKVR